MSNPKPVIEGVFAIHKPTAISSAQVLRDLQSHLNPSKTFAPWIDAERQRRDQESHNQRGKRSRRSRGPVQVKMGHGGTLDPMATGVLIVGVGNGTKSLQGFLDGTKTYEAVLLFGAATDTYDFEGKIVKRAPTEHITKAAFEEALAKFRGLIMQRPPIFSALRVNGKRLYEYAREGKEVPVEIRERPVEVSELECLEWMEPGTHNYHYPDREAEPEEKEVADKLMKVEGGETTKETTTETTSAEQQELKRKREDGDEEAAGETTDTTAPTKRAKQDSDTTTDKVSAATTTEPEPTQVAKPPCPAPAARIRMTVSSGFYVRSLCHDLGIALNSLAFMSSLSRTRQSMFELNKNVLEYEDLAKGEDLWGPKVVDMLAKWNDEFPQGYDRQKVPAKRQNGSQPRKERDNKDQQRERVRNSSSPEA
ncbi:hypothetical protein AAFC00_003272 [Neodothiora populina]|uniref:tRNA pseudouridine(55) synthase n=1 Tax=Neodothiora populina TaxID=2781224 RepID=A0ABR3P9V4_9PEZI